MDDRKKVSCKMYTDQFLQATVHYRISIQQNSLNAAAYNNLGVSYFRLGQDKNACECFERAIALKPRYLDPLKNLKSKGKELLMTRRELYSDLLPYKN